MTRIYPPDKPYRSLKILHILERLLTRAFCDGAIKQHRSNLRKAIMKFQWFKNEAFTQELIESWTLWLCDKAGAPRRRFGTLYKTETHYVIMERGNEETPMVLDKHLTLDEAKRAAKLLLVCGQAVALPVGVGETA